MESFQVLVLFVVSIVIVETLSKRVYDNSDITEFPKYKFAIYLVTTIGALAITFL